MIYDNIKWYKNKGYWNNTKHGLLHRYIYTKHNGPIPEGYIVHHDNENKTDNTPTNLIAMTRGEHIKLHTLGKHRTDETKQRMSEAHKGKNSGEKSPNVKLTEVDVKWIRVWLSKGYTGTSIAKAFKVSKSCITRIKTGKNWKDVGEVC